MPIPPQPWHPIRTERLLLRDFLASDLDDIHAYASDPELARYMEWGPNNPAETEAFLGRVLAGQADCLRLHVNLAIESDGVVVGSITLRLRNAANRTAEIGYCLSRDRWRQGFVSEAARALIAVAFDTLDFHRVVATCDARNAGSYAVMESLGMRREGLLKQDSKVKGEWRDTLLYAVLAEEWRGKRAPGDGAG